MELCLGTVQFGMDYGIRGQKRPSPERVYSILDFAYENGIRTVDTAHAYGQAEELLGNWLARRPEVRQDIHLISKFSPNLLDDAAPEQYYSLIKKNLEESLSLLHTDFLDGYLAHSSRYVYNAAALQALTRLKEEGYVRKIGVSVYETDEAKKGIERGDLDLLQLPYSLFDQRMKLEGVFRLAGADKLQLHSRSAFLQGLILMGESEIPPFLDKAKPMVRKIDQICLEVGLSRIQLALLFVKGQKEISHLVFGVDNLEQLAEDIRLFHGDGDAALIGDIARRFQGLAADIVMPSLWKR